MYLKLKSKTYS